jgi:hypothetical protein
LLHLISRRHFDAIGRFGGEIARGLKPIAAKLLTEMQRWPTSKVKLREGIPRIREDCADILIPAKKAGIQTGRCGWGRWIPAFAGMTGARARALSSPR